MKKIIKQIYQNILLLRANGQYKYLIKKWESNSDVDLAANILSIDPFREEMGLVRINISNYKKYLIISPHQDDEAIGCGGIMTLAKQNMASIDIVYTTNGATELPNVSADIDEIIKIRFSEAQQVADEWNAKIHKIDINNYNPDISLKHAEILASLIKTINPDVILTPWLLDSPPKHRMSNYLLHLAFKHFNLKDYETWGYQVHNDLIPNAYVDITDVIDDKIRQVKYFKSQNEYIKRYDHLVLGMAIWNSRFFDNTDERYYEVFNTLPLSEFSRLIEQFYHKDLYRTFRGHKRVLRGMEKLMKELNIKTTKPLI